jgi:GMP synthase-like glutamine amidotransferase
VTRALVLQTQDDAPAGLFADWAAGRGIALETARVDLADVLPDPREFAFVVALGSGASAAGGGPDWVDREIGWLRAADTACVPVLGICFGAQALAAALGGAVHRLAEPEVGWVQIETADADRLPAGPWLAWHEDRIELPPLAYEMASNRFGVQAFCHCRHLAVQFHPEVTPAIVARWADEDHGDLARGGLSRAELDAHTAAYAERATVAAERLFDGFAARAGLLSRA